MNDLRRLLDAVLDAIDIPYPATVADRDAYQRVLDERLGLAVTVARAALAEDPDGIAWNVDYLRKRLNEHPAVGYRNLADAEAGR